MGSALVTLGSHLIEQAGANGFPVRHVGNQCNRMLPLFECELRSTKAQQRKSAQPETSGISRRVRSLDWRESIRTVEVDLGIRKNLARSNPDEERCHIVEKDETPAPIALQVPSPHGSPGSRDLGRAVRAAKQVYSRRTASPWPSAIDRAYEPRSAFALHMRKPEVLMCGWFFCLSP